MRRAVMDESVPAHDAPLEDRDRGRSGAFRAGGGTAVVLA